MPYTHLMHHKPKDPALTVASLSVLCVSTNNITVQVALESVSATHQLNSAIHTLALCVRPLLLTGFAANPESAESGPVDAGAYKVCPWTCQECICRRSSKTAKHQIICKVSALGCVLLEALLHVANVDNATVSL